VGGLIASWAIRMVVVAGIAAAGLFLAGSWAFASADPGSGSSGGAVWTARLERLRGTWDEQDRMEFERELTYL
jgi:hypothetical protein